MTWGLGWNMSHWTVHTTVLLYVCTENTIECNLSHVRNLAGKLVTVPQTALKSHRTMPLPINATTMSVTVGVIVQAINGLQPQQ